MNHRENSGMNSIYCGIAWQNDGTAHHEFIVAGERMLLPVASGVPIAVDQAYWCTGYFQFSEEFIGVRQSCPQRRQLERGGQCDHCRFRDGFSTVHQARSLREVAPQLRDYIAQEHYLYVAGFASSVIKIGTVARVRHPMRWYEQGVLTGMLVAQASDGIEVRRMEAELAARYGLSQSLRGSTKAKLLTGMICESELTNDLVKAASQMVDSGSRILPGDVWVGKVDAVRDRVRRSVKLALVPAGSQMWDLSGDPEAIGQCMVWDGPSGGFVMDVKPLIGREVVLTRLGEGGQPQQLTLF